MTTDELIKQVLNPKFERTDDHASDVGHMAQFYRTAAPLLARKLERALADLHIVAGNQFSPTLASFARRAIADIKAMP